MNDLVRMNTLQALIANGGASLTVAQRLLAANLDAEVLRTNATLRRDEWEQFDVAIIEAAQDRLVGVRDLMARGLTLSFANGLGKTVLESEKVSDISDAEIDMDAESEGVNDVVLFATDLLPLPIIHKDFRIGIRKLNASRTLGEPLDTTQARLAAIKVADKIEEILFQGASSYKFANATIYGYQDFPSRNTYSLTSWTNSSKTAAQMVADVFAMKQLSLDDKKFGPWILYVPSAYETILDEDYNTSGQSTQTVAERILRIRGIEAVEVADKLTADNMVLAQMTVDTARMIEPLPITTVEWQTQGNMVFRFKVMAISIPQLRADYDGNCGIVHAS